MEMAGLIVRGLARRTVCALTRFNVIGCRNGNDVLWAMERVIGHRVIMRVVLGLRMLLMREVDW
jgi:hypothetical protein